MFSSRTNWNLTLNELSLLAAEKRNRGETILDLTESNPTRCGFLLEPSLLQSLSTAQSIHYDPQPRGLASARQSIAAWYASRGTIVDPESVFLTSGTSEAYSHVFRLLCNAGDSILVPKPSYPLFDYLCKLHDIEAIHYHLRYDDEWHIDVESLHDAVDKSTRAILLVHPNNPTGSYVTNDERVKLVEFARRHELALIVDEVFLDFGLSVSDRRSRSFAAERGVLTFSLNGISKLLALPQMKLAWLAVSGSDALLKQAISRLEVVADTYLSVGTPIQLALPELLKEGPSITRRIMDRIRHNYQHIGSMIDESSLVSLLTTEGGWNAILRLPNTMSDDAWALRLLKDCNVLVHPGHFFEISQNACVVISLLPHESVFSDGIAGILKAVDALSKQ
jgi:alanine-synthesizing transaminase